MLVYEMHFSAQYSRNKVVKKKKIKKIKIDKGTMMRGTTL